MDLSILYFSNIDDTADRYELVTKSARYADEHGFKALWIPERHFHPFGGVYPNPSVVAAALAMITKNVRIRSGSVVMPLHDPIRVAEDWSAVDNLSRGRVDLGFATGWSHNDFVLAPDEFHTRREVTYAGIKTVEALWRGDAIERRNGLGQPVEIRTYPRPVQASVPMWITCARQELGFVEAGERGLNVLSALLFQTVEELGERIKLYRETRAKHGFAPETGLVTLMLHTYVGETPDAVREAARDPFLSYIGSSVDSFRKVSADLNSLSPKEREKVIEFAFERYSQTASLIGTVERCSKFIEKVRAQGVDEVACLIDFGVPVDRVLDSLPRLGQVLKNARR